MSDVTVGRPSKYQPEYAEQAFKLCLLGATDPEMAAFFEVSETTIHNWKNEFPEFLESIRNGKIKADAELAHKLYSRAYGAEWEEEQAFKIKTGQFTEDIEIVKVKRAAPPDTSALIMWLTNRQRAYWRNTQSLQHLDKNGAPSDAPARLIVELVGEPAPQIEHAPQQRMGGPRLVSANVEYKG